MSGPTTTVRAVLNSLRGVPVVTTPWWVDPRRKP